MSEERANQERPCLQCTIVELIDDYFAEYTATSGGSDKVDTDEADEVIVALAKTFAELTSQQDSVIRQQLIEQLMREIMNYDAALRREDGAGAMGSLARHSSHQFCLTSAEAGQSPALYHFESRNGHPSRK